MIKREMDNFQKLFNKFNHSVKISEMFQKEMDHFLFLMTIMVRRKMLTCPLDSVGVHSDGQKGSGGRSVFSGSFMISLFWPTRRLQKLFSIQIGRFFQTDFYLSNGYQEKSAKTVQFFVYLCQAKAVVKKEISPFESRYS